jgi:hypothetical protein
MNDYRNTKPEFAYGTIPTAIASKRFAIAKQNCVDANAEYGQVAVFDMPKFISPAAQAKLDPFGPINAKNESEPRRRRWFMAYLLSCILWGMDFGTAFLPCYLCGNIFDCWSMDGEHVNPKRGATPGNLLLSCSGCNTGKGDFAIPPHQTREMLFALAYGMTFCRGSVSLQSAWNARTRRTDGNEQSSFPYGGMRFPSALFSDGKRIA